MKNRKLAQDKKKMHEIAEMHLTRIVGGNMPDNPGEYIFDPETGTWTKLYEDTPGKPKEPPVKH